MLKIKELWASLFIPKNTLYCHHKFKYNNHLGFSAKPCKYWCYKYNKEYDCKMEYCKYLKEFLDIQDQVKDCEINREKLDQEVNI